MRNELWQHGLRLLREGRILPAPLPVHLTFARLVRCSVDDSEAIVCGRNNLRESIMNEDFLGEIVVIDLSMALDFAVQSPVSSQQRALAQ